MPRGQRKLIEIKKKPLKKWLLQMSHGSITIAADKFHICGDQVFFYVEKEIVAAFRQWDYVREMEPDEISKEDALAACIPPNPFNKRKKDPSVKSVADWNNPKLPKGWGKVDGKDF